MTLFEIVWFNVQLTEWNLTWWNAAIPTQGQQEGWACCPSRWKWPIWISKVLYLFLMMKEREEREREGHLFCCGNFFHNTAIHVILNTMVSYFKWIRHIYKGIFSLSIGLNQLEGQVVRYTSNENLVSPNDNTVQMDTQRSGTGLRRTMSATTPPSNLMFAQSPPNMEGPVAFVAPGLAEETLMGVGQMNHIGVTFQIFRRFQVIW